MVIGIAFGYELQLDPRCQGKFFKNAPIIEHDTDCTKYYECHYAGYLVEKDCGDGTRFDPNTNVCVHLSDYPC